jgi:23S rRNA (cytidine2498-2'-O)-methyltransferase
VERIPARFVLTTCQVGAERALKREIARIRPAWKFSYSRPGFVTFKLPQDESSVERSRVDSVFARARALSLGRAPGESPASRAEAVWRLAADSWAAGFPLRHLHVWQRDRRPPGDRGFEPARTECALEAEVAIRQAAPNESQRVSPLHSVVRRGEWVLDCILVEPDEWWVGAHRVGCPASRWPGGMPPIEMPAEAVSRTFLKMEEALEWSKLPLKPSDRVVEIGSAPGGASQALLRRGLFVVGIDPADMHPAVLAHPAFEHWKMRGADVRKRRLAAVRWLTADMNVAPNYTLDTVEGIVTHRQVHIRGLLLTLKLIDWKMADDLPQWLGRIQSWGFPKIAARQLTHNRQEVCVCALRAQRKTS